MKRCRLFHDWKLVARVSPPLWDINAKGLLYKCQRCGEKKAK